MVMSSAAGPLSPEIYFQGTVYLPKAKVVIAILRTDGPVFADGLIARAFVVQSDAWTGTGIYDGYLIQAPDYSVGPTPLQVYLTAWTCATGSCAQPPSTAGGWKVAGRTSVKFTDAADVPDPGARRVSIQSLQVAR